jgi:hypothetical protein
MDQTPRGGASRPQGPRTRSASITPATYWRRRIGVLVLGIGLLYGFGWGVDGIFSALSTGAGAAHRGGTQAMGSARVHLSGHQVLTRPSTARHARPVSSQHQSTPATSKPPGSERPCAPADITLLLSSPQFWYQTGKTPYFAVRAVSDSRQPCSFNMGAKFVSVVIDSHGRRIWNSADCVSGGGSNEIVLTSGVQAVLNVSWNRRTSSPGCTGSSQAVGAGEYQVAATTRGLRSKTLNLVLGAEGASGP